MPDLKLSAKLLEAGIDEQVIAQMDRNALMNAWAEIVASSKEKGSGGTASQATSLASYNSDVEKRRLEIEMEIKMKELALKGKEYEDRKRREDEEREERKRKEEEEK